MSLNYRPAACPNWHKTSPDMFLYIYSVEIASSESFLHGGEFPTLIVQSTGHALHVFINGELSGAFF